MQALPHKWVTATQFDKTMQDLREQLKPHWNYANVKKKYPQSNSAYLNQKDEDPSVCYSLSHNVVTAWGVGWEIRTYFFYFL